jgi:hypothetical protein
VEIGEKWVLQVGKEKELDILTFRMVQPESYLFI